MILWLQTAGSLCGPVPEEWNKIRKQTPSVVSEHMISLHRYKQVRGDTFLTHVLSVTVESNIQDRVTLRGKNVSQLQDNATSLPSDSVYFILPKPPVTWPAKHYITYDSEKILRPCDHDRVTLTTTETAPPVSLTLDMLHM